MAASQYNKNNNDQKKDNRSNRAPHIKTAPPPGDLPLAGREKPWEASFMGWTNHEASLESKHFLFGLKRADRRSHVYILGRSGVGKTKMIELLGRQDIAFSYGACFIQSQGELIDDLMDYVAPKNKKRIVQLSFDAADKLPSFNPLASIPKTYHHQYTNELVHVFANLLHDVWNPRLEHVLRFALLALLGHPNATLRDLIDLLSNNERREKIAEAIQDDLIQKFWQQDFEVWNTQFAAEAVSPLVTIMGQFFSHPTLQQVFSNTSSSVSFTKHLKNDDLIFINLASNQVGQVNARLLGGLIVAQIKMAFDHVDWSKKENDFYVYLDDVPYVINDSFQHFLDDARKRGLCFTIAHQHLGELPDKLANNILGNIGTIMVFRLNLNDAMSLRPYFNPVFDARDMPTLGLQQFYIRMLIDGDGRPPFSAKSLQVLPSPYK